MTHRRLKVALGFFIVFMAGCSYTYVSSQMSEVDAEFTREGWTLKCTEVIDNRCMTHQWFEE